MNQRAISSGRVFAWQACVETVSAEVHQATGAIYSYPHDIENSLRACAAIVAIPVCNEEQHIADCLIALACQSEDVAIGIVVLLNNCTDNTCIVVRDLARRLRIPILIISTTFPPELASAGYARHLAMRHAEYFAGPDCVLMTTDADSRVYSNWIAANFDSLRDGADAVAGRVELDRADAQKIPTRLHEDDAQECEYDRLLDQIRERLDPDPSDPWPRHTEHSGASIAVKLDVYLRAGGLPAIPIGEDRAFFEALRKVDAKIRHAPDVRVVVSGRIIGRAVGGMADTIRRRLAKPDRTLDERVEPARTAARRAWMRRLFGAIWRGSEAWAQPLMELAHKSQVSEPELKRLLVSRYFGEAWAQLEVRSPVLTRRPVMRKDLNLEMNRARQILCAINRRVAADKRAVATSLAVSRA
jgi:hypothetical protein